MDLATWHKAGHHTPLPREGLPVFWRADGAGPTVLLLHGFPTSSHDWAPLVAALAPRWRTVALDFLGFGASAKPRRAYPYALQLDAVDAVARAAGITDAVVIAHDYGVTVGQELLARARERRNPFAVRGVIFLNGGLEPALHRPRPIQRFLASPLGRLVGPVGLQRVGRAAYERGLRDVVARPDRLDFDALWAATAAGGGLAVMPALLGYMRERRQLRERLLDALLHTPLPVAFAWGRADPVSGDHVLRWLRAHLPAAPILALDGVGHYPQLEAPDEVAAWIAQLLDAWA